MEISNNPELMYGSRNAYEQLKFNYKLFKKATNVDLRRTLVNWKDFPIEYQEYKAMVNVTGYTGRIRREERTLLRVVKRAEFYARLDTVNEEHDGGYRWLRWGQHANVAHHHFQGPLHPANQRLVLNESVVFSMCGDNAYVLLDRVLELGAEVNTDFKIVKQSHFIQPVSAKFRLLMCECMSEQLPVDLHFDLIAKFGAPWTFQVNPQL